MVKPISILVFNHPTVLSEQPVGFHLGLPLDLHHVPELQLEGVEDLERGVRGLAAVDLQRLAVALHPRGRVDRVSEQAVARHLHPHHARAARAWGAV